MRIYVPAGLLPVQDEIMTDSPRTVIIGLDGVPFGMLKDFAEADVMPNTGRLIRDGLFTPMRSTIPEISSVAWSSIITGVNPGEHGIFGFVDIHPDSYKMRFPNFSDLKQTPFWGRYRGKSIIMNVPSTYPVGEMNGVHISGFVSIDFEKSVYPKPLIARLKEMDYRLDVDSQKAHNSIELFLEDLDKTLEARILAWRYLWDSEDWQIFMLVFTGTDRLMHFLFDAYEDKSHKYHNDFLNHFHRIDCVIGEICSELTEDDFCLLLSDHGFEMLEKDIYVNHLLSREGFLSFNRNSEPKLANIAAATKAFALDPARIFINQRGKYPAGSVEPTDRNACLKDLKGLFDSLQVDGRRVIRHIYRKEDIYSGPYLDSAADMILIADKGFNLKGSMAAQQLADRGPFTGKHTYQNAFLLIRDKRAVSDFIGDHPSVIDAGRLIRSLVTGG
jgi:predicted AlkP superfamily phosphohydrolase/phosphomutase